MAMNIIALSLVLLVVKVSEQGNSLPRVMDPAIILDSNGGQCPSTASMEAVRAEISQNVISVIMDVFRPTVCDGTDGWRQVAFYNMTDTSYDCPPGLTIATHRNLITKRTCGRPNLNTACTSTTFSVEDFSYSKVCGRIIGYQYGDTDAFYTFQSIETNYVSGVSLTHGADGSRQHIWTFAAGITQNSENHHTTSTCPCDAENQVITPQAFIGDDYMCESSPTSGPHAGDHIFYGDNPLWDGEGCKATSTCCVFNTPPWFTRELPGPTTDDIEMCLCGSVSATNGEDTPLELIELYVK